MRQIAINAGIDGAVVVENIRRENKPGYGYNVATDSYSILADEGIIDPTKVTRSALQNAASVAAMVLTTESLVTDIPTPPAPARGARPGYGRHVLSLSNTKRARRNPRSFYISISYG